MNQEAIKILVIDDDEEDYILTCELFAMVKSGNYQLDWASSYEEGLRIAARLEHHVCLVDYRLGNYTGADLIRAARLARLTTPMILLTGQGDHKVDVDAMEAGATDYLIKDETSPTRLERTVRYAVQLNAERCLAEKGLVASALKHEAVVEIGRIALTGGDLKDLFVESVALVATTLEVEYCKVLELAADGESFIVRGAVGWTGDSPIDQIVSAGKEVQSEFKLRSEAPLIWEDLQVDQRLSGPALLHEKDAVSGMSAVIRGRKGPFGILSAMAKDLRKFGPEETNLMVSVANVLAEAIGRKRADEDNAERARVSEALRESEERYRMMVDRANDIIYRTSLDGQFTFINPTAIKITGYSEAELIGMSYLKLIRPDYHQAADEFYRKQFSEKQAHTYFEYPIVTKTGAVHWLGQNVQLVLEHDRTVGFQAMARDITDRKLVQEDLRKSEERFALATRATKDVVWDWDLVTNALWWNEGFQTMFGYNDNDVGSDIESWTSRLHPDDLDRVSQGIREAIDTGQQSWTDEYRFRRADGTYSLVSDRGYVVHDGAGKPVRMLGSMMDVTDRKRVAAALEEAARRERAMIENALDVICTIDREGRFISVSQACLKMWGYEPEEMIGRSFLEFVSPEDAARTHDEDVSILSGKITTNFENCYVHKNGWLVPVVWTSYWSATEQLVFAVARDNTQRKQLEEQLKQAHDVAVESARLKSEFLANMSHEIRTPMNGVIGMTGLLRETDLSFRQREYTDTIQLSADALLTIIDDILDFSKIEAGLLRFETIDFELRAAVEASVELFAERAQSKGLELASLVYQNVPTSLRGDPGRLRQVLTNLLGNSVKFTDQGEVVISVTTVRETSADATLRFEIRDTGIGISTEAQQRLFLAFSQADGSTTRKYGGTGLGLAISKQLVTLMGGEIGIDSIPGEGSTFWFTGTFEKQLASSATITTANPLSGVRVLIVDDNDTNRRILKHQTGSWGMISAEADSGRKALELLRAAVALNEPFDVAVLDLWMPDIDGFQLAQAIKADPAIAGVILVLLPSFGRRGHGERAAQVGISAYLPKPVRQSQLQECLTAVMSNEVNPDGYGAPSLITRHSLRKSDIRLLETVNSRGRILVAEDNDVNQMVALGQLSNLGYQAEALANGLELLKAHEKQPADIILMDCQMPEMDGFAATAEIRRREGKDRHTPIIAMTANAFDGDHKKCLAAGMDDYLSKPVNSVELGQKLARWTKLRRQEK
jgi:PAS domain S-box-containing protein